MHKIKFVTLPKSNSISLLSTWFQIAQSNWNIPRLIKEHLEPSFVSECYHHHPPDHLTLRQNRMYNLHENSPLGQMFCIGGVRLLKIDFLHLFGVWTVQSMGHRIVPVPCSFVCLSKACYALTEEKYRIDLFIKFYRRRRIFPRVSIKLLQMGDSIFIVAFFSYLQGDYVAKTTEWRPQSGRAP